MVKSLLISLVVTLLFSSDAFTQKQNKFTPPQKHKTFLEQHKNESKSALNKINDIYYLPQTITTDTLKRTYTWDAQGNPSNIIEQTIVNGTLTNSMNLNYTYSSSGQILEMIEQHWNGTAYVNYFRISYSYDSNNLLILDIQQQWQNNGWVNKMQSLYSYENGNDLKEMIMQNWINNAWVNVNKTTLSYVNHLAMTNLEMYWDNTNNVWVNFWLTTYEYNAQKLRTLETSQVWGTTQWNNDMKIFYSYSNSQQMTEQLFQMWQGTGWENSFKTNWTYNAQDLESELISQTWNNGAWENVHKSTKEYDANKNLIQQLLSMWTTQWDNDKKFVFQYTNNNATQGEAFGWDNSAWVPKQDYLEIWFNNMTYAEYLYGKFFNAVYTSFTGVNDGTNNLSFELQQNYPNPFNPATSIEYSIQKPGQVKLTVYDMLGKEVSEIVNEFKSAGKYSIVFNAGNLASGVYFYMLTSGGSTLSKKLIYLK